MKRVRIDEEAKEHPEGLEPIDLDLMLDSGAFGAWTRGETIDVEDYIAFVRMYGDLFTSVVNLDVIPGDFGRKKNERDVDYAAEASYENLQAMKEAGIPAVPVFHQGEEWKHLYRLLDDGEPYIGISPSGDSISVSHGWFDDVFSRITDSRGVPYCKTHGFGVTAVPVLLRYPWYSFDSVTWVIKSGYGCVFIPKGGSDPATPFDYAKPPTSVWVTGAPRKNDRNELQEQGLAYQRYARKFVEEEVKTTMHNLRYDPYARMEAMAVYYQKLSRLLVQKPFKKTGSLFDRDNEYQPMEWPMKKAIFAVGPTGNVRRSAILNRLGIRERLLSYFDLRETSHVDIMTYAKYGATKATPRRKPLKFKNLHRVEFWNRKRILHAERFIARGDNAPYVDPKDSYALEIIRKQLNEA